MEKKMNFQSQVARFGAFFLSEAPTQSEAPSGEGAPPAPTFLLFVPSFLFLFFFFSLSSFPFLFLIFGAPLVTPGAAAPKPPGYAPGLQLTAVRTIYTTKISKSVCKYGSICM